MKRERICDAVGLIDDDIIRSADAMRSKQVPRKKMSRSRWGALAACLCLAAVGCLTLWGVRSEQSPIRDLLISLEIISPAPHSADQHYYDWSKKVVPVPVQPEDETAIIPHWEDMTIVQQFSWLEWEGRDYSGHDAPLPAGKIGTALGTAELTGSDEYSGEKHSISVKLYAIEGISTECAVAVQYAAVGDCYPFVNSYYKPATLGQFIDDLSLTENLSFHSIWYDGFTDTGEYSTVELTGAEAAKIWELLLSDRAVENVKEYDNNPAIGQSKMHISIDVPLLGYQNICLAVTDTGYLTTNLLDTGKAFYLGSDKVDAFMDYVFENCQGYLIVYDYGDGLTQANEDTVVTATPYDPDGGSHSSQGATPPN